MAKDKTCLPHRGNTTGTMGTITSGRAYIRLDTGEDYKVVRIYGGTRPTGEFKIHYHGLIVYGMLGSVEVDGEVEYLFIPHKAVK